MIIWYKYFSILEISTFLSYIIIKNRSRIFETFKYIYHPTSVCIIKKVLFETMGSRVYQCMLSTALMETVYIH